MARSVGVADGVPSRRHLSLRRAAAMPRALPPRSRPQVTRASAGKDDEKKLRLTYKGAGVDIDAGDELVRRIAKMAPGIGGFGGFFPYGARRPPGCGGGQYGGPGP